MTIFIDLDGTILDVSERIYRVYRDILKKKNKKYISKKDYLRMKREKAPIEKILKKTSTEDISSQFKKEWKKEIEKPYYLSLDRLSLRTKKVLYWLKKYHKLVLITFRCHPRRLFDQLKERKIWDFFDKILIIPAGSYHSKWKLKYKFIKKYGNYDKKSIIIGDTETDIFAGKKLGIKTVAVINGMRSKKFLQKYKPDILIENFSKFKNAILRFEKTIQIHKKGN